jgi:adenylylsulfate kinase
VARLFNDAGLLVIAAFISPYRADRRMARDIVGPGRFIETHLCADIGVCEHRDSKGLYKKARAGGIPDFTGVSAPYEVPELPELTVDTGRLSIAERCRNHGSARAASTDDLFQCPNVVVDS